jgi:hypothetical protein
MTRSLDTTSRIYLRSRASWGCGMRWHTVLEVYPETDEALGTMPTRFAALAQWYEVTWGKRC